MRRRPGAILLVDDCDDARAAVRDVLRDHGYEVLEARNGQEAMDLLVAEPVPVVKLIVLDLEMPVMNGWEFLRVLSSYLRLSDIPVLIVSGHSLLPHEAAYEGVVGCLQAPYEMDQLLAIVNACSATASASSSR